MAVRAVIFDWGGTLTPWHTIDHDALWLEVCTPHFSAELATAHAKAIKAAEFELWRQAETAQQSATLEHVFTRAGVTAHDELLATYYRVWEPHTYTDPDAAPVIDPGYLTAETDLMTLVKGLRLAERLTGTAALRQFVSGPMDPWPGHVLSLIHI